VNEARSKPASRRNLIVGLGLALIVAAAGAVMFVLPAEYGIDPTGVGKATGLIKISEPGMTAEQQRGAKRSGVLTLVDGPLAPEPGRKDHWEYELGPFESIEFKYTLAQGDRMTFEWSTTGQVRYDMHAHPFEGGTALTESYGVDDAAGMKGRYVAPFTGIHGWYWQNRTFDRVEVTLDAAGAFTASTIFDTTGEHPRPIEAGS
jgi:hypothetical protein